MKINYSLYQEEIVKIRRKLHMHPETAFNEFKTTAFIKDYLENIGYDVKSVEPTGCTALLEKDKSLPYIVVRAEMDAVPIDEKTNLSFASKEKGAMHACGHDANMAAGFVACLRWSLLPLLSVPPGLGRIGHYIFLHGHEDTSRSPCRESPRCVITSWT